MPPAEHIIVSYMTVMVICLIASAATFLFVGWRLSAALQGFVESQAQRGRTEEKVVTMFQEYIEVQRQTHEQFWMALQVQADRLNRHLERKMMEGS